MPRVSVVIPAYNHEKYVAEAIQSVLDQTYQDFEIVLTNDGSTDGTADEIRKFKDPRITLLSFEKNRGFIAADNNCIRNSSGEFVAELSSDDMFLPHKLEAQVNFLDAHPDIAAVFGYPHLVDEDGNDFTDVNNFYYHVFNKTNRTRHEWLNHFFYKGNCLAHPSVLIRRECLEDIGFGDERLVQLPDLDLWIRLCLKYEIHILPEKVFKFRIRRGEANLSGDRLETRIRDPWEHEHVLRHFLRVGSVGELHRIFPHVDECEGPSDETLVSFLVAKLALEVDSMVHRRFALGVLFDLMGNKITAARLKEECGFDYNDLIKITGRTDIYNYEITNSQRNEIETLKTREAERRGEIEDLKTQTERQRGEIENLKALETLQRHEIVDRLDLITGRQTKEIEELKVLEKGRAKEIEELRAVEKRQAKEIEELKVLEKGRAKEIEELRAVEKRQAKEIEELSALEKRQTKEIEELRAVEKRQTKEIGELRAFQAGRAKEMEELRALRRTMAAEMDRLKTIEDSLIWRNVKRFLDIFDARLFPPDTDRGRMLQRFLERMRGEAPAPREESDITPDPGLTPVVPEEPQESVKLHCDSVISMSDVLDVAGWAVSRHGIESIEVYYDGDFIGRAVYGHSRPDVQAAFPSMLMSDRVGFSFFASLEKALPSNGESTIVLRAVDRMNQQAEVVLTVQHKDHYAAYLRRTKPDEGTLGWMRGQSGKFRRKPVINLLQLARADDFPALERSMESVRAQAYPFWKLILLCEKELSDSVSERLKRMGEGDRFIICAPADIPRTLGLLDGEFVGFLNPDDFLAPEALFEMVRLINTDDTVDLVYADEDSSENGRRKDFFFKPDWSPDLLLGMNYIGNCFLVKRRLLEEAGGVPCGLTPEGIYDLLLRVTERTDKIAHIPSVLLTKGGVPPSAENAGNVLEDALVRRRIRGEVIPLKKAGTFRVKRSIAGSPKVSIIIPTAYKAPDMFMNCLTSIIGKSTYPNYEIVVIDHSYGKLPVEFLERLVSGSRLRVLPYEGKFNFSHMNNMAASKAGGEYFVFLNDDTEIISPDWIEAMLEHAQRPEVGVVGAKLLYPDDTVQHAGMFLVDQGGGARHAFRFAPRGASGYKGYLGLVRNCSSVTFACAMVSKGVFERLGGLDENLRVEGNDLDFCLRAGEAGYLVVWTPFASLYHKELATRVTTVFKDDVAYFWNRWRSLLEKGDSFYNPNLTLDSDNYSLNMRPVRATHHEPKLSEGDITCRSNAVLDPSAIKKILVVKLDHIGDVILCFPALKMLKRRFPNAKITMLAGNWAKSIVQRVPELDEVLTFDFFFEESEKGKRILTSNETEYLEGILKSGGFDLALDLRRHPETRGILKLSGAACTAGYCTGKDDDDWLTVSLEVPQDAQDLAGQDSKPHIAAQLCDLILALDTGGPFDEELRKLEVPALSMNGGSEKVRAFFPSLKEKFLVGIHPGAGNMTKQWPADHFARLADLFIERNGARVLIFGGQKDKNLVSEISGLIRNKEKASPLAGEFSLDEFMDAVKRCHIFVGNDSGPCHIAGVLGVPTVTIFSGKVSPSEWHPLGEYSMSIKVDVPCSPCYKALPEHCAFKLKCLRLLWPEKVWKAASQLGRLSGCDAGRRSEKDAIA